MQIEKQHSLLPYNSFKTDYRARYFVEVTDEQEAKAFLREKDASLPVFVLGKGCNTFFTRDFPGYILRNGIKGVQVLEEKPESVVLCVNAGEDWESFVDYCVAQGWGGIENLSLIPSSVGATPVQNIGAYGVELSDVLVEVNGFMLDDGTPFSFSKEACAFGYRSSIFKTTLKGKCLITSIKVALAKQPELHTNYGDIKEELRRMNVTTPTIKEVSTAIKTIRTRKLPDVETIPNAGSFFKNPIIPVAQFEKVKDAFPAIPYYPQESGVKLAAGWLIEQAGWKGKRMGEVGVHAHQALVLVNYGIATGEDIVSLATAICKDVKAKFGVALETEVNVL